MDFSTSSNATCRVASIGAAIALEVDGDDDGLTDCLFRRRAKEMGLERLQRIDTKRPINNVYRAKLLGRRASKRKRDSQLRPDQS